MMYNFPTVEDSRGYIVFSNEGTYFLSNYAFEVACRLSMKEISFLMLFCRKCDIIEIEVE